MLGNLTGWHALIILAVVVLIFGAAKLPALARSVGQSVRILQKEVQKVIDKLTGVPVNATKVAAGSASRRCCAYPYRTVELESPRALGSATLPAENWSSSNSCAATSQSKQLNVIPGVDSGFAER